MTIVHIMQGLPASGKTTFARTLDAMRFNLDDYRAMMWGDTEWSKDKEHVAVQAMLAGMTAAIKLERDCCADNTHLTPSLPKTYRKTFARLGVTFQVHSFADVSLEECLGRDMFRENRVGKDVICRLAANYEKASKNGWRLTDKWMNGEPYIPPEPYVPDYSLMPILLCDIDGTVALNDGHRGHYEYEKVIGDKPNFNVINVVRATLLPIVFMSGREDRCRDDTIAWLKHYVVGYGADVTLFMRTTGDHRPDYVIKGELFDAHVRKQHNVLAVFDDRDQVVSLWRNMGLTCLQVADGEF